MQGDATYQLHRLSRQRTIQSVLRVLGVGGTPQVAVGIHLDLLVTRLAAGPPP